MKYIIAIGIFQALLAAVLLWRGRLRNQADDLLIMLVMCIGVHLSIKFFIFTFVKDAEVLSMMNTFVGFCYIPLLYLYTLKTIRKEFIPASRWQVFIPFFIGAIGYFSVVSVLATAPKAGHVILYWYNMLSLWSIVPLDIIFTCWIIYLAMHRLPKQSSEKKLIIHVASLFLTIGILGIIFMTMRPAGVAFNYLSRSIIYAFLVAISIRIITYRYGAFPDPIKAVAAQEMVAEQLTLGTQAIAVFNGEDNSGALWSETQVDEVYKSVSNPGFLLLPQKRKEMLSSREMFNILLKLENALKIERYYTDSGLTLDKLAKLIKQNKYHISETLNHFVQKPFYTFVNEYRIQYVKHKLEDLARKNIEVNILTLAYEAGFNSKSSFNRYFKEITFQTPTTYFKTILKETQSVDK
jgi:AraC-like DNA-binding protein